MAVWGLHAHASADTWLTNERYYTVKLGENRFGFVDGYIYADGGPPSEEYFSHVELGPLGTHPVSFSAAQGLIGFLVVSALFTVIVIVAAVRWNRDRRRSYREPT